VSVPTTLSDLERRDMRVNFFSGGSPLVQFDVTKFGRITHLGRNVFLGVIDALPQGGGPNAPQFWGFPSIFAYTL